MELVRRRWTFAFACLALLAALLVPQASQAQVLYGSLVGNVKDTSGATMPGATVTITNNDTKLTRETVTNSTGGYDFATVPTGSYTVKLTQQGFKSITRNNVLVTLNGVTRVDLVASVVSAVTSTLSETAPRSAPS